MRKVVQTAEDVREVGAVARKLPREDWFIGKKGYRRTYRPDGTYTWEYRHRPNDGGKLTHAGAEGVEMLKPWLEASANRQAKVAARQEHVAMRSADGELVYVVPERADDAARRNGWRHHWRSRGSPVVAGPDGMFFRPGKQGWEPLGIRCFGQPLRGSATVSKRGLQRDPDGRPWRWFCGRWEEA